MKSVLAVIAIISVFRAAVYPGVQAVTCRQVETALLECVSYLTGKTIGPSLACCEGVKEVKMLPQTAAEKRTCCGCLKAAADRYADLKDPAAVSLPEKCHVKLDIPISRGVDCDKIN